MIKQVNSYCYILEKLDGDALESCRLFKANDIVFKILNKKNITSPKTFWQYAKENGHAQLADFAMKFLKFPASTAQLERLFSNWTYVHSDIRNRLSEATSKKLVAIYFTLRSADQVLEDDMDLIADDD